MLQTEMSTYRKGTAMKTCMIAVVLVCFFHFASAQDIDISSGSIKGRIGEVDISIKKLPFLQGSWELATSGTFGSLSTKQSYNLSYPGNASTSTSESTLQYAYISATAGYYLIDGLSIEPEFAILATEQTKPGQSALLNLSYTYLIKQTAVAPYIRAGYGLGNSASIVVVPELPAHSSSDFDVKTINVGAGVKFLVAQGAAIRIEVNYKRQNYTENFNYASISSSREYTYSSTRLWFGVSILL